MIEEIRYNPAKRIFETAGGFVMDEIEFLKSNPMAHSQYIKHPERGQIVFKFAPQKQPW